MSEYNDGGIADVRGKLECALHEISVAQRHIVTRSVEMAVTNAGGYILSALRQLDGARVTAEQ
jgi:hypothetical protein